MSTRKVLVQKQAASVARSGTRSASPSEYLGQGWFPVNGILLQEIRKKLLEGEYTNNRRALIDELKKDFSLLGYCLKNLQDSDVFVDNPIKMLEVVPFEELVQLLSVSEGDVSNHGFKDPLKSQALRYRHSMISCNTAEAIAEKAGVDPDIAFSCALIRQLGLNLIAWNYPRIYTKALASVADGREDLETVLFKSLGFAPRQVAVNLTVSHLTPDLKIGLGLETSDDQILADSLGVRLAKFCEISETFAQINDPEHYPVATRKWKGLIQDINHYMGPKGLQLLKEKIDGRAGNYATLPHKVFDGDLSLEKNLEIASRRFAEIMFAMNPSAAKITEDLQGRLKRVYSMVRPGQVSPEALQALILECIPASGFVKGCVFLLDPASQALIPKLRIGERTLDAYKAVPNLTLSSSDNPILEALQSSVPVKRDGAILFGDRVSLVSGVIGNGDKTGVLYLELSDKLASEGGFEPVLRFKAIRHCLNLCLNLQSVSYN